MKALILAGDQASALPQTLGWLKGQGIDDVAIAVDDLSATFEETVGDGIDWGVNVVWTPGLQARGSAGIARDIAAFFDDTFVILRGDRLFNLELAELLDYHRARRAELTIGLRHVDAPARHSMVECDSMGSVIRFAVHPANWTSEQHTASIGMYLVEPSVLATVPGDRPFDWEEHVLPLLVTGGERIFGQLVDGVVTEPDEQIPLERQHNV